MGRVFIPFILFITLICSTAFAQRFQRKNIAVVETMIDGRSDAASLIKKAEVSEITNEIRRGAIKNLPRDRFSVMTTETVQSMGDAVLAECAEENCVIVLGTTIGADYIVRGVISMFEGNLTLSVEIFETEYGMLVAAADPVRSANLGEFLEKTSIACEAMYKTFVETSVPTILQTDDASEPELTVPPVALEAMTESAPQSAQAVPAKKSFPLKLTLRISTVALAVGGIAGGIYFNGKGDNEYDKFKTAAKGSNEEKNAKTNTENHDATRNLLYIIGGVGLAGFAVTLFF